MCNHHSPGVGSDHIDYIEMNRNSNLGIEEPWFFVVICSLCIILFVSAILSIILLKCRDSNCSFHDSNLKQHQMTYPKEREQNVNAKSYHHQSFGGVGGNNQLMPAYNPPLPVLWAQLTPHGTTQHFISEPFPQQDNHYEAIEYNNRQAFAACVNDLNKSFKTTRKTTTMKSSKVNNSICSHSHSRKQFAHFILFTFHTKQTPIENKSYVDFEDYADPAPLIAGAKTFETEEIDSGISANEYQDPQQYSNASSNNTEFFYNSNPSLNSSQFNYRASPATMTRHQHRNHNQNLISTPVRIANPNIPALNSRTLAKNIKNATMNHQQPSHSTLNKQRISSASLARRPSENQ